MRPGGAGGHDTAATGDCQIVTVRLPGRKLTSRAFSKKAPYQDDQGLSVALLGGAMRGQAGKASDELCAAGWRRWMEKIEKHNASDS
jgi:hypothetical protein